VRFVLAVLLFGWALALPATAHPSHTSFAQIGWSADGTALEISLRVIPEDLEGVLGQREGEQLALQDNTAHRAIIAAWLQEEFVVRTGGQALPQQLAGLELGYDKTWIYFTVSAHQQQLLELENTVLQRYVRERGQLQINQVQRLWGPAAERLTFSDDKPQVLWQPAAL
jgi:Domain of unknown function (DUF6702)